MPVPATGNFLRWTFGGNLAGGEIWRCVHWRQFTSTVSPSTFTNSVIDLAVGFSVFVWNPASNPWKANVTAGGNFSYSKGELYQGGVKTAEEQDTPTVVPSTGANGPALTCMCLTLQTGTFSRAGRGRMYLPYHGGWDSTMQGNNINSTVLTAMKNWLNVSIAGGPTGPATVPVVMSLTHGAAAQVSSIRMDSKADVQHGRQRSLVPTFRSTVTL